MKKILFILLLQVSILPMNFMRSIFQSVSVSNIVGIGLSGLMWGVDHFQCKDQRNRELIKGIKPQGEIDKVVFPGLSSSQKANDSASSGCSNIDIPVMSVSDELVISTFREKYKDNHANKESAPIAYRVMQKLDLNYFANQQYESREGFHYAYFLNSIGYSLLYVPMYYVCAKLIINYKKYSINPLLLMCLAELATIGTKMTLCHYEVDKDSWWKNPDQKKLSALMWIVIGSGMAGLTRLKK